ncbi:hypothetical protein RB195_008569 [Necator americanus]|uniref:HTH OST-type domain-containing protein n=1 Tax=Necator americanus TaxID=51031 RepID=A0ABR1CRW4_NECAM
MASISSSSENFEPDEELVRDAALCLRSFSGSREVIPYSKFCERFKKTAGYSIKEYLQKCDYTFADVMIKVSCTTRTKCEYDVDQKMITLIPEKALWEGNPLISSAPTTHGGFSGTQPIPVFIGLPFLNPYAPLFVPRYQPFMFTAVPLNNRHPFMAGDVPYYSQFVTSMESNSVTENASLSSAAVPWSTCDSFGLNSALVSEQDTEQELASIEECEQVTDGSEQVAGRREGDMDELHYDDAKHGGAYDVPTINAVDLTDLSVSDEPTHITNVEHFSVEGSDDSYYYDAEEEFTLENRAVPIGDQQIQTPGQFGMHNPAEDNRSETGSSTVDDDLFDGERVKQREPRRDSMPELPILRSMDFCVVEPQGPITSEDVEDKEAKRRRRMLHVFWLLKANACLDILQDGCLREKPYSNQKEARIEKRRFQRMERGTKGVTFNRTTPVVDPDIKQLRIDAKKECLRLWSADVRNMAELLCFLKVFHNVNGPMLIDDCEYHIEAFINPSCTPGDLSWIKYGKNMSVRRMFELKMFRLVNPNDRKKVQPVDCVLNAGFRILSKGVVSEVYKILTHTKKGTIEDITQQIQKFVDKTENECIREVHEAINSAPDVFAVHEGHVELRNDDEFFVVTDIA